jgi:hypothetical protein
MGYEDQVLIKPVSVNGPPLSVGWAFWTTKLDEAAVTLLSEEDTTEMVTPLLGELHST